LLRERPAKVAMPAAAVTAAPPVSVEVPGLVPMARLTWSVLSAVTTLPKESSRATVTAGAIEEPARALVGWVTKTSLLAAPAVMLKAAEVAAVSVPLEATRV
jgi:hypothetical protein